MPELSFVVEGAEAVPFAASPQLVIKLALSNREAGEPIHSIALRCQIMIDPVRRQYTAEEQERMLDIFGEPERWGRTLRPMLWVHTSVVVPSFTGTTVVDLPVPCTFDFNVAATKYFAGVEEGEIPLNLLFSGTIFYAADSGAMQIAQIPWDREARYRLPAKVWKQMMDTYYPNTAWLCLRRDVFNRLYRHKVRMGLPTWEAALESLLSGDGPQDIEETLPS